MVTTARNERRLNRARLLKALPAARRAAETAEVAILTDVLRAQAPHFTPDNMDFVEIGRGELGGWIANLKLKRVPAGVPDAFGTPARYPLPTREEAEASVTGILTFALACRRVVLAESAKPPPRVFDYFGFEIEHHEEILAMMEAQCALHPGLRYGSTTRALERLDQVTERLFPGGKVTAEGLQALDRDGFAQLHSVLAMAAIEGMFRYPEWPAYAVGQSAPLDDTPADAEGRR